MRADEAARPGPKEDPPRVKENAQWTVTLPSEEGADVEAEWYAALN